MSAGVTTLSFQRGAESLEGHSENGLEKETAGRRRAGGATQVSRGVRVRLTTDPQPIRDQGRTSLDIFIRLVPEARLGRDRQRGVKQGEEGEGVPGQGSTWALSRENGGTQGRGWGTTPAGDGEDGVRKPAVDSAGRRGARTSRAPRGPGRGVARPQREGCGCGRGTGLPRTCRSLGSLAWQAQESSCLSHLILFSPAASYWPDMQRS